MTGIQFPGTTEQRDERRGQLVGVIWRQRWRDDPEKHGAWFELVRERTGPLQSWIWARRNIAAKDAELERLREQVAGAAMIAMFADGSQSQASVSYFQDASKLDDLADEWLFTPEALKYDGWIEFTGQHEGGKKWTGWKKKS